MLFRSLKVQNTISATGTAPAGKVVLSGGAGGTGGIVLSSSVGGIDIDLSAGSAVTPGPRPSRSRALATCGSNCQALISGRKTIIATATQRCRSARLATWIVSASTASSVTKPAMASGPALCVEAGPFNPEDAASVDKALRPLLPSGSWTRQSTVIGGQWMVYMGPYPDEDLYDRKVTELKRIKGLNFEIGRAHV
mgnify:CR=1 FL=1